MGKVKLAFRLQEDDRLIVMAQPHFQGSSAPAAIVTETIYDHEDLFLKLVIYADFDDELTRQLVIAVILSVAEPARPGAWIPAEISVEQNELLGLNLPPDPPNPQTFQPVTSFTVGPETGVHLADGFPGGRCDDFLMDAPGPFAKLMGAGQIVTSVNPPVVRTLRRSVHD